MNLSKVRSILQYSNTGSLSRESVALATESYRMFWSSERQFPDCSLCAACLFNGCQLFNYLLVLFRIRLSLSVYILNYVLFWFFHTFVLILLFIIIVPNCSVGIYFVVLVPFSYHTDQGSLHWSTASLLDGGFSKYDRGFFYPCCVEGERRVSLLCRGWWAGITAV